jgi:hypothetical protein
MPRDYQRKVIDAVRRSDRKFGLHATEEVEILRNAAEMPDPIGKCAVLSRFTSCVAPHQYNPVCRRSDFSFVLRSYTERSSRTLHNKPRII